MPPSPSDVAAHTQRWDALRATGSAHWHEAVGMDLRTVPASALTAALAHLEKLPLSDWLEVWNYASHRTHRTLCAEHVRRLDNARLLNPTGWLDQVCPPHAPNVVAIRHITACLRTASPQSATVAVSLIQHATHMAAGESGTPLEHVWHAAADISITTQGHAILNALWTHIHAANPSTPILSAMCRKNSAWVCTKIAQLPYDQKDARWQQLMTVALPHEALLRAVCARAGQDAIRHTLGAFWTTGGASAAQHATVLEHHQPTQDPKFEVAQLLIRYNLPRQLSAVLSSAPYPIPMSLVHTFVTSWGHAPQSWSNPPDMSCLEVVCTHAQPKDLLDLLLSWRPTPAALSPQNLHPSAIAVDIARNTVFAYLPTDQQERLATDPRFAPLPNAGVAADRAALSKAVAVPAHVRPSRM